jgi:tRNA threonylcarbamoyladenosine biosynthesis protein TsaB
MLPTILALDTSTEALAVALVSGERRWCHDGAGGAQASATLLPTVKRLLAEAELALPAIDAIAFCRGPGAFTGLRTACSVAQGLALGLGCPVLPLSSLWIPAQQAWRLAGCPAVGGWGIDVLMDARMGELYAAAFRRAEDDTPGTWQCEWPETLCTPAAWFEARGGLAVRCIGSGLGLVPALAHHPEATPVSAVELLTQGADRSEALADLAIAAWQAGELADPAEALPTYLRDKVAQTTAERAAAALAAS